MITAEPVLELNPKWQALDEVMKEIQLEIDGQDPAAPIPKTLIVAEDDRTCHQLRQILESGSRDYLTRLYQKTQENADRYKRFIISFHNSF